MSFSPTQIRKLQQDLHPDCIRTREIQGRRLSYIEGWHAIAEANRIFGFDSWNRETVENRCVLSRELSADEQQTLTDFVLKAERASGAGSSKERAAYTALASVLFNLDAALTR